MNASNTVLALTILALGATACGKNTSQDGSSAGPASSASTTSAGTQAGGAVVGTANGVGATCNDPDTKICKEYLGAVPVLAADFCKGPEGHGVFTKGGSPCSREKLSGTCVIKTDAANEVHAYYLQGEAPESDQADVNKIGCEMKEGKWTAAPPSAKPSSTPAPAKAPAAKPAKKK
jgi:hypothetical protein